VSSAPAVLRRATEARVCLFLGLRFEQGRRLAERWPPARQPLNGLLHDGGIEVANGEAIQRGRCRGGTPRLDSR